MLLLLCSNPRKCNCCCPFPVRLFFPGHNDPQWFSQLFFFVKFYYLYIIVDPPYIVCIKLMTNRSWCCRDSRASRRTSAPISAQCNRPTPTPSSGDRLDSRTRSWPFCCDPSMLLLAIRALYAKRKLYCLWKLKKKNDYYHHLPRYK